MNEVRYGTIKLAGLLVFATILFSLSDPFLKLIIEQGKLVGLKHPDAISFCNVLFVGNLCAGLVPMFFIHPSLVLHEIKSASRKDIFLLLLESFCVFLYPSLVFYALIQSSITNFVILSQVDVIAFAFVSWLTLKTPINKSETIGYAIIVIGIITIILINNGFKLTQGDFLILAAAFVRAISDTASKKLTDHFSLLTIITVTNILSAIVFFFIAVYYHGIMHFGGLRHGDIWISMIFYAGLTITLAGYLWIKGIKHASSRLIVNVSLLLPFLTILSAFFLLNEIPSKIELIVFAIVVTGLIISNISTEKIRSLFTTSVQV